MSLDVCIIGSGVLSLSIAVNMQRLIQGVKVTIIADKFGNDTLSIVSTGLFLPIFCKFQGIKTGLLTECFLDGWRHYFEMAKSPESSTNGLKLITGHYSWTDHANRIMSAAVFNYRKLHAIEKLEKNFTYPNVCSFTTVQFNETKYLRWLMKEFRGNGGQIRFENVNSLQQFYGKYDAVINCVGRRGRELISDPNIRPRKGHKLQVESMWAKNFYITEDNLSAVPVEGANSLDVGCLWEENVYTNDPDPDMADLLLHKATSQIHRLVGCEVTGAFTELKPYRDPPKVEVEMLNCGGPILPVVHCLGLGHEQLTLSWGLGIHVAHLAQDIQRSIKPFARITAPFGRLS